MEGGTVSCLLLVIMLSWPPVQCLFCHMHSAHTPPRPDHVRNNKDMAQAHAHAHTDTRMYKHTPAGKACKIVK